MVKVDGVGKRLRSLKLENSMTGKFRLHMGTLVLACFIQKYTEFRNGSRGMGLAAILPTCCFGCIY